jgi:hypothetical protein
LGHVCNLVLLNRGTLPLNYDPADRRVVLARIAESDSLFVGHPNDIEIFKGVSATLLALAAEAGYRREMLAEISDRNGRPMFEVFRFRQ